MHHRQGVTCGILSCAPFGCFPWPYCLLKPTFLGHEEQGLEPLHNIADGQCP